MKTEEVPNRHIHTFKDVIQEGEKKGHAVARRFQALCPLAPTQADGLMEKGVEGRDGGREEGREAMGASGGL